METWNWLKFGAIVAMVLGSCYILAPTVVRVVDGPQAELQAKADSSQKKVRKVDARIGVRVPAGGDSAAAATAIESRLKIAGVPHDLVTIDGKNVEVVLAPGGRRIDIEKAITAGQVVWYDATGALPTDMDLSQTPNPTVSSGWSTLIAKAGSAPAGEPLSGSYSASRTETQVVLTAPSDAPPVIWGAVGGQLRWVAFKTADGHRVFPLLSPEVAADVKAWPTTDSVALAGNVPDGLQVIPREFTDAKKDDAPLEYKGAFPAWFRGMLSDTAMKLGRDLQGGIEMTVHVDLDAAVLAEAHRDATAMQKRAESSDKEGEKTLKIVRDRNLPVVLVSGAKDLSAAQSFISGWPYYTYASTDMVDGAAVHRFAMSEERIESVQDESTKQVLETLRQRINGSGVNDAEIVGKGRGRIGVQLPGTTDIQAAAAAIGTTAVLEFRLVDGAFDDQRLDRILAAARDAMPEDQVYDPRFLNRWLHETKRLEPDRLVFWEAEDRGGRPMVLFEDALLTGSDVASASVLNDPRSNDPYVQLEMKTRGSQIFCEVTTANVGKQFAILLDDQIQSAPVIKGPICSGPASIEMGSDANAYQEATNLALVLRTGSLNAPVLIGERRVVGPTLGADAIRSGSLATAIGSTLVFLFMTLWYRKSGLVANFTLATNVLIMMAILALAGANLTLPGIAGVALTVGMAVDANIIIYERIREELKLGVNARKAVDAGFEKAFSAIMDGNITTAIAGIVLFSYGGSEAIKGFAVTMIVGIITTVITALFVSRTLMELLTRNSAKSLSI